VGKIKGTFRDVRPCHKCAVDLGPGFEKPFYCWPCRREIGAIRIRVTGLVHRAIHHGDLPHPKNLKCADCGEKAQCYDHRSYEAPLEVVPVCRSCNHKRGPAIWKAA
jgi:hypothetical protein